MKKYIYSLFTIISLIACEETVQLDLNNTQPVYIIEGLITDQFTYHYVRVTKSVDFYAKESHKDIDNAVVSVTDGINIYSFTKNAVNDIPNGYYVSTIQFAGEAGKTYSLTVDVDGEQFTASDYLAPVTSIDSLTFEIDENEFEDPDKKDYFYEVLFYAHEPQETEDYYLFKFYRNDSLVQDYETDIYFSNDDLLAEQINGIPTASFYTLGDSATVEMYSISNAGFIYYNDLINLLNSDGGMFGSPPVNPRTNIKGGALGFFQTSSKVSQSILIEE